MSRDFASLIASWPRLGKLTAIGSFAKDIGVDYQHAATMKQRNSIAPEFWPRVLKAAERRGKALSHEQMLKMREARRGRAASEKSIRPSQRACARLDDAA